MNRKWSQPHQHKLIYQATWVVILLVGVTAIAGLTGGVYATDELRNAFLTNDLVNLLVGIPMLVGTLVMARRDQLSGLLFLPGALFFVTYNYLVYVLAMPLSVVFLIDLVIVTLSIYTAAGLLASLDAHIIHEAFEGPVPARMAGGALVILGGLFLLIALGESIAALANQASISAPDHALHVVDFALSVGWVIGGALLWQREPAGYTLGVGLLFQATILFIGLLIFMLLQPIVTGITFQVDALVTILVFSLIVFVPFAMFLRALIIQRSSPS